MQSLSTLYRYADNLGPFVHPLENRRFRYMTDSEVIALAKELTLALAETGVRNIVVSETGASPLAEICTLIAQKQKLDLTFFPIKFPRMAVSNISAVLLFYLTESESQSPLSSEVVELLNATINGVFNDGVKIPINATRAEAINALSQAMPANFYSAAPVSPAQQLLDLDGTKQSSFQSALSTVYSGSSIARRFSEPFIYFDEYIDSGTTMGNAVTFFHCFAPVVRMKTASYYLNVDHDSSVPHIAYTRFRGADRPACYIDGAYPFENRIDLIGHYYTITDKLCVRTLVQSFGDSQTNVPDSDYLISCFLEHLDDFAHSAGLLPWIKARCQIPQVAKFIDDHQLIRFLIWSLEDFTGDAIRAEFLFQLFDMNGPAWSPLPTDFHFDFWQAFDPVSSVFREHRMHGQLFDEYQGIRQTITGECAKLCNQTRVLWWSRIVSLLEENDVSCTNCSEYAEQSI